MLTFLRSKASPAMVFDALIAYLFRTQRLWLAEGLLFWFRGTHRLQYVGHKLPSGLRLWLNPYNFIDRLLLAQGHFDQEVVDALQVSLKPSDVLWDVGANIGLISFSLLRHEPSLRVVAFEPSPFTYAQLHLNNELQPGKIQLCSLALSDRDGAGVFSVKINRNSGMSTLRRDSRFSYDCDIQVLCARADLLVKDGMVPAPNVMKIDVEGAELAVLLGMGTLLDSTSLRCIVFEGPTADHADILALLTDKGFVTIKKLGEAKFSNFIATRTGL